MYSKKVYSNVMQACECSKAEVDEMDPEQVWREFLSWEGLVGYDFVLKISCLNIFKEGEQ